MNNKLSRFLLFFLVFLLALQLFNRKSEESRGPLEDVVITSKKEFVVGQDFKFQLKNNTDKAIELESKCPAPPVAVEQYQNGVWSALAAPAPETIKCNTATVLLEPKKSTEIDLTPWSIAFFSNMGKYKIALNAGENRLFTREFDVVASSFLRDGWNFLFFKPIFNTLVFLISIVPGRNLGVAILLLTIIIKLILLAPNQKALKAQKKMQAIQPHLEDLKSKHKDDKQKLAQETMALWKKHNVSPAGSCLPMLIQFPILIALFYVVKSDLNSVSNTLFLYEGLKHFDLSTVQTNFFGLMELTKKNLIVLPVIVGTLQFLQMRLTLSKKPKQEPAKKNATPNPSLMMNKMMIYMMPVMIAFFTASMPAAVGFYWGASTLFGIGQQVVVNRSKD